MNYQPISLDTFIPELPKKWNNSFKEFQRYLDVFYNGTKGIIIKPIETTGKVKGARGEFTTTITDNLVVRNQWTNLYENFTTADVDYINTRNGLDASIRDASTSGWPYEDPAYKWIDVNSPYLKITPDNPIALQNKNLGQVVRFLFNDPTFSGSFEILLDPCSNKVFELSGADSSAMYLELITISYDASWGPVWEPYKYGVLDSSGAGGGSGTIGGSGTLDYIPRFTSSTDIGDSAIWMDGNQLNTFSIRPNFSNIILDDNYGLRNTSQNIIGSTTNDIVINSSSSSKDVSIFGNTKISGSLETGDMGNVKSYVDLSLGLRDVSIDWLNTNKASISALNGKLNDTTDTFSGVLTIAGSISISNTLTANGPIDLNGDSNINSIESITSSSGASSILFFPTETIFVDNVPNGGLKYSGDYSDTFTDRSFIDKGYMLAYVDGSLATLPTDSSINDLYSLLGGKLDSSTDTFNGILTVSGDINISNDVAIGGNLTVNGSTYFIGVETLDVSSAYIFMNTGFTGTPPSTMQSGIVVERGDNDPYAILFDETNEQFRVGITNWNGTQYEDSSTQAVATRQDSPLDEGIVFWNNSENRFDTFTDFTYDNGANRLNIGGILNLQEQSNIASLRYNSSTILQVLSSNTGLFHPSGNGNLQITNSELGLHHNSSVTFGGPSLDRLIINTGTGQIYCPSIGLSNQSKILYFNELTGEITYDDPSTGGSFNTISIDSSIQELRSYNSIQDASILALSPIDTSSLDASIVSLRDYDAIQDASILALSPIDTSSLDASIVSLRDYDAIQDASILALGSTYYGENGISVLDSSISLGGALIKDTSIQINTNVLQFTTDYFGPELGLYGDTEHRAFIGLKQYDTYAEFTQTQLRLFQNSSRITLGSSQITIATDATDGSIGILSTGAGALVFDPDISQTIFTDYGNENGIQYASDYSATFNPLSIIHKQFMTDYVDGSLGTKQDKILYASPASNGAGTAGEFAYDSSYFYVCTSTNTWGRIALELGY
jgi:hypothetical protein